MRKFLIFLLLIFCCGIYSRKISYYISAEEVIWDYAPNGKDMLHNQETNMFKMVATSEYSDTSIGRKYIKAQYVEYEDKEFKKKKDVEEKYNHKGILGPIIRAEVGDTIQILFYNNLDRAVNIHPQGLYQDEDTLSGEEVLPKQLKYYTWQVNKESGPTANDPSSISWIYHSSVNTTLDTNSGLLGLIIITAKGKKTSSTDFKPKDVDYEFITSFNVFNENKSPYLKRNIEKFTKKPDQVNPKDEKFEHCKKKKKFP